jgi:hypothetical protein
LGGFLFGYDTAVISGTNEDCMIGMIHELQVFDGCIYILDRAITKSLFVFDMEGRFIKKIGCFGNGPGEFIQPVDITLDTELQWQVVCECLRSVD